MVESESSDDTSMWEIVIQNSSLTKEHLRTLEVEASNQDRPIRCSLINCTSIDLPHIRQWIIEWLRKQPINDLCIENTPHSVDLLHASPNCRKATIDLDPANANTRRFIYPTLSTHDWSHHTHMTHFSFHGCLLMEQAAALIQQLPNVQHVVLHSWNLMDFEWVQALLPPCRTTPLVSLTLLEERFGKVSFGALQLLSRVCHKLTLRGFYSVKEDRHTARLVAKIHRHHPILLRELECSNFQDEYRVDDWMTFLLQSCPQLERLEWESFEMVCPSFNLSSSPLDHWKELCFHHLSLTTVNLGPNWKVPQWWMAYLRRNKLLQRLRQMPSSTIISSSTTTIPLDHDVTLQAPLMAHFAQDPTALYQFMSGEMNVALVKSSSSRRHSTKRHWGK